MIEIDLQVAIQPDASSVLPDAVTFECGSSRAEVADPSTFAYNHHGEGFGQTDPGALTSFFEDLILGRPLPLKMVTHKIQGLDTVLAMALFLQRDLAIHPRTPGLVYNVDLVHRRGLPMLGHIDRDLGGLFRFLGRLFLEDIPQREVGDRLGMAVRFVREYLTEGQLPPVDLGWAEVVVVDRGTGGFVVGRTLGPLVDGWVELFRQGHLKGVLWGAEKKGRRSVVLARKSSWVRFDLEGAVGVLNGLEEAAMGVPEWQLEGDWLWSPSGGSLLRPSDLLQLAVRL